MYLAEVRDVGGLDADAVTVLGALAPVDIADEHMAAASLLAARHACVFMFYPSLKV